MARFSDEARSRASIALVVLGALLLLFGSVAWYGRTQIIDRDRFADRAVDALDDDDVRQVVASEIVVNLIERGSTDLIAARPLLESVVDATIQTRPFRQVFRAAAAETNKVFFVRDKNNALFDLSDTVAVVRFGLQSVSPKLAHQLPQDLDAQLVTLRRRDFAGTTLSVADHVRIAGVLLPILALLAFVGAVAVSPDRRVGVLWSGVAVGAVGVLIAIATLILESRVLAGVEAVDELTNTDVRDAVRGLLDAYLGDLVRWSLLMGLIGLAVAGAAAALDPSDVEEPALVLRRRLARRPQSRLGRALRGALLVVVGVLVVLNPTLSAQIAAVTLGAYLVFLGTSELLLLLGRRGRSRAREEARRRRSLRVAAGVASGAVALLVALILVVTSGGGDSSAEVQATANGCNGSRALCGLRLNQVVFAGTHNSFSAADSPGWYIANQRHTIARQLEDGIRLFLIDAHWGIQAGDRVRTDFRDENRDRNKVAAALPPDVLRAAERLAGRVGAGSLEGKPDVWLCHTVCELGATRMVDELETYRKFLERNRGAVIELFIEPYVSPQEIEKRFEQAGLERYVATLARDEPLPTLGRLVRENHRVVVFTEKDADGTVPWYLDGFSFVQDTPLGATKVSELECRRYRGTADSPLLMLNHWADVFPPQREANKPFLRKREVLDRAHECAKARGMPVNMIAVDHYDVGDLIPAVQQLNEERVRAARRARG